MREPLPENQNPYLPTGVARTVYELQIERFDEPSAGVVKSAVTVGNTAKIRLEQSQFEEFWTCCNTHTQHGSFEEVFGVALPSTLSSWREVPAIYFWWPDLTFHKE